MSVVVYPAIITPAPEGRLEGRFVDLATTFAATAATELVQAAREALTAELQRREAQGDAWPDPTPLQDLATPAGSSALLVDVSVDDTPIRLTISLGERLLKRIDQDAEARSMTRSGYLALGARLLLSEARGHFGEDAETQGDTARRLQAEITDLGRRVSEALGPDSPVGRVLSELDAIALDGLRRLGAEVRSVTSRASQRPPPRD